jgi:hypothetical protein
MPNTPHGAPLRTRADQFVRAAWILGVGGLVPFVVGALLIATYNEIADPSYLWLAVSAWAAVILSFLGGARWGAALNETARKSPTTLALSVVPSLAAWALVQVPQPWNFVGFAVAFSIQGVWDYTATREGRIEAPWYAQLRLVLTAVVVLCMVAVAFATNQPVAL